jgi:hypothetical protein
MPGRADHPLTGDVPIMTTAILIGAPLTVVLGFLFWVLSFYQEQHAHNVEAWKKHGIEL